MKKTLVMILAIMLVICLCFAVVGCNDNTTDDNGGDKTCTQHVDSNNDGKCDKCGAKVGGGETTPAEPTEADIKASEVVRNYTEAWLVNNASTQNANKLATALGAIKAKYENIIGDIKIDPVMESNKLVAYKITYRFSDGKKAKIEQIINVATPNEGSYAGLTVETPDKTIEPNDALCAIINAAFKTCKVAVENGQGFNENGFGFDATAYFDFYYGDMAEKLTYGLRVAGQIGIQAKDTFAGIEVLNGTTVLGGLYYDGAENKEDCKLYLNAGDYKYYINNADVNSIVISVIDAIQQIIGGQPSNPGQDVSPALATPFYDTTITKFSELFPADLSIVGDVIAGLFKDKISTKTVENGTQYQLRLDVGELLNSVKDLIPMIAQGININEIIEQLPAPLNQLKLDSFQGVGGALMITAVVNDNGLGGLEISYNAPRQDFRFSNEDPVAKVYGPINVALGIRDFELGAQEANEVIPSNVNNYTYFSPLNGEVNVDVVVNDVAYKANIVSAINPFALENGVITFVVDKDNVAWLNGRLEIVSPEEDANGWNALVAVDVDGQIYKFYAMDAAMSLGQIAGATFEQVMAGNNVFTPIISYIQDLIAQFTPAQDPSNPPAETVPAGETVEEEKGGLDINAIVGAFDIIDAAKALIAEWETNGVLVYKLDGAELLDNYFQVKLSADEYNAVIGLINQYIGPIIGQQIPELTDANAADVLVNANYGEHAKQIYVSVDYKGTKVLVLLDGQKWETEKVIELKVTVNEDVYALKLDASVEDVYNVTYTAKDVKYVDVTLNLNDSTLSATLLANGNTHNFKGTLVILKDGEDVIGGTIKLNLDGVVVDLTGKRAYGEVTGETSFGVPTVKFGAQFGWVLPSNTTNVKVDVTTVSWGEEVTLADNAALMTADATGDINVVLQAMADAFLAAIEVPVKE